AQTARQYLVLGRQLEAAGVTLPSAHPIMADFPIWLAEAERTPTLALPDEPATDVLDLATDPRFEAGWLVIVKSEHGRWPDVLADRTDPASACFTPVQLPVPSDPADAAAIDGIRLYRIGCP
ncbi:MAG: hypothetical protein WCK58_05215, partial [Chloroflexota bacterium]